jgi:hypothetical protein
MYNNKYTHYMYISLQLCIYDPNIGTERGMALTVIRYSVINTHLDDYICFILIDSFALCVNSFQFQFSLFGIKHIPCF